MLGASLVAHGGTHVLTEPCTRKVISWIEGKTRHSTTYLSKLAENGAQRIFVITKDDLGVS